MAKISRDKSCPMCGDAHARKSEFCTPRCRRLANVERERAAAARANAKRYKEDPEFRAKTARHQREWTRRVRERIGPKGEHGFRSAMEERLAPILLAVGATYESHRFLYPMKPRGYRPDFMLPNGIALEVKGWFPSSDRTKLLAVKAAHPDLDLRIILASPRQRLGPKSKTTQAEWCEQHRFPWAQDDVPTEWLFERTPPAVLRAAGAGILKGVRAPRARKKP